MCGTQLGKILGTPVGSLDFVESVTGEGLERTGIVAGNPQCLRFAMRMAVVASVRRAALPPFLENRATHPVKVYA